MDQRKSLRVRTSAHKNCSPTILATPQHRVDGYRGRDNHVSTIMWHPTPIKPEVQARRFSSKTKLHQHRPQTATNHMSTTFIAIKKKKFIGCPILEKETKEKKGDKPGNPSPEPEGARKLRWNTILFLRKERKER